MIKGEAIVQMVMFGCYCTSRHHAILKIGHELKLSEDQVNRLIDTNGFKDEEIQKLCDLSGYVVTLMPKESFRSVPIGIV